MWRSLKRQQKLQEGVQGGDKTKGVLYITHEVLKGNSEQRILERRRRERERGRETDRESERESRR